jgi:hypothetical protein
MSLFEEFFEGFEPLFGSKDPDPIPHHNAKQNPDTSFHLDADPDPLFHFYRLLWMLFLVKVMRTLVYSSSIAPL